MNKEAFLQETYDSAFNDELEKIAKKGKYEAPYPLSKLPNHLKKDPTHNWRARTGIELIHKEPYLKEQKRIWRNWNLMTPEQKEKSDKIFDISFPAILRINLSQGSTKIESSFSVSGLIV